MAIWEDVKKGVTDAYSYTKGKAEKYSDLVKIKIAIRSEEHKQVERYEQLGRFFYTTYKKGQDLDADILDTIVELDKGRETIENLKADLAAKQHMAVCPNCGAEIELEANFCPVCGAKIESEAEPEIVVED